jgi:ABC-type antimicrobial peptide transport system permease subunit
MALGASRSSVIVLVFREALAMTAIGLLVGGACAFAVGRLTANSLFGVAAFDPLTIAATSAIIAMAAVVAVWVPAQRASRVDPMVALRAE